jgi:hypothetical protein
MLRDILTVYFIVAGCLLLWVNFRRQPRHIVLTKDGDDQTDVAHPHPEQNASDDDLVPVPHLVAEGAESPTRAEDGDASPEGDLALEARLQREIALQEMARNARTGSTTDDRKRAFAALIGAARSPAACSRAKSGDDGADQEEPDLVPVPHLLAERPDRQGDADHDNPDPEHDQNFDAAHLGEVSNASGAKQLVSQK